MRVGGCTYIRNGKRAAGIDHARPACQLKCAGLFARTVYFKARLLTKRPTLGKRRVYTCMGGFEASRVKKAAERDFVASISRKALRSTVFWIIPWSRDVRGSLT